MRIILKKEDVVLFIKIELRILASKNFFIKSKHINLPLYKFYYNKK